jgi:hypothetical protein
MIRLSLSSFELIFQAWAHTAAWNSSSEDDFCQSNDLRNVEIDLVTVTHKFYSIVSRHFYWGVWSLFLSIESSTLWFAQSWALFTSSPCARPPCTCRSPTKFQSVGFPIFICPIMKSIHIMWPYLFLIFLQSIQSELLCLHQEFSISLSRWMVLFRGH